MGTCSLDWTGSSIPLRTPNLTNRLAHCTTILTHDTVFPEHPRIVACLRAFRGSAIAAGIDLLTAYGKTSVRLIPRYWSYEDPRCRDKDGPNQCKCRVVHAFCKSKPTSVSQAQSSSLEGIVTRRKKFYDLRSFELLGRTYRAWNLLLRRLWPWLDGCSMVSSFCSHEKSKPWFTRYSQPNPTIV